MSTDDVPTTEEPPLFDTMLPGESHVDHLWRLGYADFSVFGLACIRRLHADGMLGPLFGKGQHTVVRCVCYFDKCDGHRNLTEEEITHRENYRRQLTSSKTNFDNTEAAIYSTLMVVGVVGQSAHAYSCIYNNDNIIYAVLI